MRTENPFKNAHEVIIFLRMQTPWSDFNEFAGLIDKEYYANCQGKKRALKFGKVLNDDSLFMISSNVLDDAEFHTLLDATLALFNEFEIVQVIPFKLA
ncbi:hypothetical protein [Pedobacter rhizosphaerae]|uniref:Uncharacterized protein n=1 Tax=Pedobacter rhizosphaerae TaxID=390241 RepID=A0A1H9STE3_9SPHI|nr:hypothetical protein [Pedobacter rhizosphaerae]SER88282.1 hypothetical protein SAMN04488023_11983 [Pedobacter rhizosphaerae]